MDKKRYIILVIAIISFGLLLTGGTYAWLVFSDVTVNGQANGTSTNFYANYNYTNDDGSTTAISGTLMQTSYPKGGLSGQLTMSLGENSSVQAKGYIYLNVSSADGTLYKSITKERCESFKTLETLPAYTSSSDCTSAGHVWASSGSALKYALYRNVSYTSASSNAELISRYGFPVATGYITGTGNITIRDEFALGTKEQDYTLYIWLDGELADSSYASLSFNGYVHLGAEQVELGSIYGDLNGDSRLTTTDSSSLNTYLNDRSLDIDLLIADVNIDGFADEVDYYLLEGKINNSISDSFPMDVYEIPA